MLCRMVLTAVVVSCTFSPEIIAHSAQDTQRILQIKDLICVLWLSGLQKEDLDVNVLRKLQRHNVNIDDMNNETLKQECANRSNSTTKSKDMTTSKSTNAGDNYEAAQLSSNNNNNSYFETIAKYLADKRTATDNNQPEVHQKTKIYSQRSYADFSNTNYFKQEAKNGPENIVESSRPDLQKILQFWQKLQKPIVNYNQDIKKEGYDRRTDFVENLSETKIVTKTTNRAKLSNENINQLLSEFISRNVIAMSTTKTPKQKLNDLESNLESLYYKLIANNMKHTQENIFTTSIPSNAFNDNTFKQPHTIRSNNMGENVSPLEKSINEVDLLLLNDQLKSFTSWHSYQNDITQMPNQNKNNKQTSETGISNSKEIIDSLMQLFNKQPVNSPVINAQPKVKEQILDISNDAIREIAEHIKGFALQDFRKKIIWNTTSSSTTTTMMTSLARSTNLEPSTESPRISKLENESEDTHHVFDKFLELFEQVKATKEKTIITADTKYHKANVNHEYLNIINKKSKKGTSVNVVNLPYRIEPNPVINLPMFRNSTPHGKRVHTPSIIQTNSDEIAPLVIPISKPMKVINQVLLVTSAKTKHQRWAQPVTPKMNAYFNNRHLNDKESPEYTSRINNQERDFTRFRYDDNYSYRTHIQHKPEAHSNNKYTHDRLQEYQINKHDSFGLNVHNFDEMQYNREPSDILEKEQIDTNRPAPQHNRERFHEKLERPDGRLVNFFNFRHHDGRQRRLRVASRQQQPVNSIKNNFKYNDIHFRNFLKTQQKVNAMLERILATKTSTDEPFNSFEIA